VEITNKVANSKLITINLEDYYLEGQRVIFDIKDWLFNNQVLKEKEFREHVKSHDWSQFKNKYVALTCSTEAIIPGWAYILITIELAPFAKKIAVGSLEDLETILYAETIHSTDFSDLKNGMLIIKGCSKKPVPPNAYLLLSQKLQPIAKSIMYGEACSSVPLYKKK
jgi:hypothetical protein